MLIDKNLNKKNMRFRINKKNCTSIENPDYLICSPHYVCRDTKGVFTAKKDVKKEQYLQEKGGKNIITNAKFGMSKDSPFISRFSESHVLTESLFEEKNVKMVDYNMNNLSQT